jgi:hypothetical protein
MNVGIGGCDDSQLVTGCEIEVAVDVTLGIDDDRLTASRAPNQIGKLRKLYVGDLPHEHDFRPPMGSRAAICEPSDLRDDGQVL